MSYIADDRVQQLHNGNIGIMLFLYNDLRDKVVLRGLGEAAPRLIL